MTNSVRALAMSSAACVALFAWVPQADAQVYKCQDDAGKTVYADAPCTPGGKPLRLQDATRQQVANPTACAQLLDETRRLATEAQRDAQRGKVASTSSAKRRRTLEAEYQRRCAGISRTSP